jgi:hypothetical protein
MTTQSLMGGGIRHMQIKQYESSGAGLLTYAFKSYSEYSASDVAPTLKVRDGIGKDGTSVLCVERAT